MWGGMVPNCVGMSGVCGKKRAPSPAAHSRERGNPDTETMRIAALGPHFRGEERNVGRHGSELRGNERSVWQNRAPSPAAHSRASGNPDTETMRIAALDPRFRGEEQNVGRHGSELRGNERSVWQNRAPSPAAHSRASGNPDTETMRIAALGPRVRGDDRNVGRHGSELRGNERSVCQKACAISGRSFPRKRESRNRSDENCGPGSPLPRGRAGGSARPLRSRAHP
jgi:hypothetical protein